MPKLHAGMHLDTVFTFADRDLVTYYPDIVDDIQAFPLRPSDDEWVEVPEQKDSFAGVVFTYGRNTQVKTLLRNAGIEGITMVGARPGPRGALHDVPDLPRRCGILGARATAAPRGSSARTTRAECRRGAG